MAGISPVAAPLGLEPILHPLAVDAPRWRVDPPRYPPPSQPTPPTPLAAPTPPSQLAAPSVTGIADIRGREVFTGNLKPVNDVRNYPYVKR